MNYIDATKKRLNEKKQKVVDYANEYLKAYFDYKNSGKYDGKYGNFELIAKKCEVFDENHKFYNDGKDSWLEALDFVGADRFVAEIRIEISNLEHTLFMLEWQ